MTDSPSPEISPEQREKSVTQLRGRLAKASPEATRLHIPVGLAQALVAQDEHRGRALNETMAPYRANLYPHGAVPSAEPATEGASGPEHPFDPDAPKRVVDFLDLYEGHDHADLITHHMRPKQPGFIVFPAELRATDLRETLRQLAYFRKEFSDMAEASANWRGKYEERHARADRLQALADERARTILELSDRLDAAGAER